MVADAGCEALEKGACSERLSTVMPERFPWEQWQTMAGKSEWGDESFHSARLARFARLARLNVVH